MSLSHMNYVEVMDQLVDVDHMREIGILNGGAQVSYRQFQSQSNGQNINLTLDPPDEKTIISPRVFIEVQYTCNFVGTNSNGSGTSPLLNLVNGDAPRSCPFHNTLLNSSITFNGQQFQTTQNEYFSALQRTGLLPEELYKEYSSALAYPDLSQQYVDLNTSVKNPLNNYQSGSPFSSSRGSIAYDSLTNTAQAPGAMTAQAVFTTFERFVISPLYNSKSGISNARTFSANFQFGNLNRVWSHFDSLVGVTLNSMNTTITNFVVHMAFITPKLERVPRDITVPYHEFLILNSQPITLAVGANASFTVNSVNLGATPGRILVFAREQDSDLISGSTNYLRTDSFATVYGAPQQAPISSLQYGNRQGLMSGASAQDLYQVSLKNGLQMSWPEFSNWVGSVVILNPAIDFGLERDDAPSCQTNPQFSITCSFKNTGNGSGPNSGTKTYTMYAIVIYSGSATFGANGTVDKRISTITHDDVLRSIHSDKYLVNRPNNSMMGGGDLFGNIKHFLSNVPEYLGKANNFLRNSKLISNTAKEINDPYGIGKAVSVAADKFGYGRRAGVRAGVRAGSVVLQENPYYEDMELEGGRRKMKLSNLKKKRGGSMYENTESDDEE